MAAAQLEYFAVMRGPWDRQDHHKPFAVSQEKPEGAGYYPADLEKERWNSFLEEHPDKRAEFESLLTVITGWWVLSKVLFFGNVFYFKCNFFWCF